MPDKRELTSALKSAAWHLGFDLAGVCPAGKAAGYPLFLRWLEAGYGGEMTYLSKRAAAYEHPHHVLHGAQSLLMLGMSYCTAEPNRPLPGQGRISRYAWGSADYHDVIRECLERLIHKLRESEPQASARGVVDTAPLLERDFAQLAGVGWIGKNTLLLNAQYGSWVFLAAVLTDLELEYDSAGVNRCGSCRACLDACPTRALREPYVLDATRCISYLTIELRGEIPRPLRGPMGDWLFGCDVCQEVCPWNRRPLRSREPAFLPRQEHDPLRLEELFCLTEPAFHRRFRHTPLWRAKRRGVLRNAAIVLGNQRARSAVPALMRGLRDAEPQVRAASAWALGRISATEGREALGHALGGEPDGLVRREIQTALGDPSGA